MPYPPPPGPPDVGEFQAIGKLPAPELPDVTGHGGEFLETDGIIPQWQPVSGVLPDPTGHAGEFLTTPDGVTVGWSAVNALPDMSGHNGEFLTTDGSVASWAPGGGGGGVTTVGALTTATANAAVITGVTLQLAPADQTNPGLVTTGVQHYSGLKTLDDPIVFPWDVRRFGAVPNDPTNDLALAYYACLAAQPTGGAGLISNIAWGGSRPAEVYIPAGTYYISMPLVGAAINAGGLNLHGDGPQLTIIAPGLGGPSSPGNVQGFSGPVLYENACFTTAQLSDGNIPVFTTPLVGGSGQSLVLTETMQNGPNRIIRLHDSFPWGSWIGDFGYLVSNFSLQFWVKVNGPLTGWSGGQKGIIGSRGPDVWWTRQPGPIADIAFGVYAVTNGSTLQLKAYLTTNPAWTSLVNMQSTGTVYTITSGDITPGDSVNVELDYNGSFFDFYIDGVNQGHVAVTGPIIPLPPGRVCTSEREALMVARICGKCPVDRRRNRFGEIVEGC